MKKYRVWIEQVNATYIDVKARSEEDAKNKALFRWRKEAWPETSDIQEMGKEKP